MPLQLETLKPSEIKRNPGLSPRWCWSGPCRKEPSIPDAFKGKQTGMDSISSSMGSAVIYLPRKLVALPTTTASPFWGDVRHGRKGGIFEVEIV